MGEDTNTVSREEREATKCVVPSGAELEHRKVRSPGFGYCWSCFLSAGWGCIARLQMLKLATYCACERSHHLLVVPDQVDEEW